MKNVTNTQPLSKNENNRVNIARENTIISENYARGLNKGLAQGRAEGSHAKAIETAHNLIKFGMSIAQISEATGLSITEIKQLR